MKATLVKYCLTLFINGKISVNILQVKGEAVMTEQLQQKLRQIPSVHDLMQHRDVERLRLEQEISAEIVTLLCQESVQELREKIINKRPIGEQSMETLILNTLFEKMNTLVISPLRPLINGTGVVLHTNLGRAKLSTAAIKALTEVASHYSSLEYDIPLGKRGSRHSIVEDLICRLTGAEAALVCNNNAAAVFLALKELATNKEVLVSRGELIEIGGSFRVFEIMRESGAHVVEVGTTNKTHLYDYEREMREQTGLIMKVHTSNFVIEGFTDSVPGTDLVNLAHKHNIPIFEDLGSGVLLDLRPYGIGNEPTVQEVLNEGIDLVSFSGDKLLGGPQAGILAGKKSLIDRLKKHQLMRSLRVDKFTLAALHETLKAYLDPEKAIRDIPTLHMILQAEEEIKRKAELFIENLSASDHQGSLIRVESEVGGGTLPNIKLPSWGVQITPPSSQTVSSLAKRLRLSPLPVIGRVHQDQFILDFRTIVEDEIPDIIKAL